MYLTLAAQMEWYFIIALIAGGFAMGIINTIAGNGSAFTLPLLLFIGLDANTANATNRVGSIFLTLSAVYNLPKSQRTRYLFKESSFFIPPVVIGSIIGATVAVEIPEKLMLLTIGVVMILVLFTLLTNPKKWLIKTDGTTNRKTVVNWLAFLGLGFYGGFIQMGFGVLFLTIGVLLAKYALRDANIMKLLVALTMVLPAFIVFTFSGDIRWIPGLALAVGTTIGARIGTRYILQHPKANAITRKVLIVVISVALVKIFSTLI